MGNVWLRKDNRSLAKGEKSHSWKTRAKNWSPSLKYEKGKYIGPLLGLNLVWDLDETFDEVPMEHEAEDELLV